MQCVGARCSARAEACAASVRQKRQHSSIIGSVRCVSYVQESHQAVVTERCDEYRRAARVWHACAVRVQRVGKWYGGRTVAQEAGVCGGEWCHLDVLTERGGAVRVWGRGAQAWVRCGEEHVHVQSGGGEGVAVGGEGQYTV